MNLKTSSADFLNGLVFGFDVGTGSIGYAVRHGSEFLDVGVLICPEDTSKLDTRRGLRSQRRRLRNRHRVREWFGEQLDTLGLPSPYMKSEDGRIQVHPKGHPHVGQPVLKPGLEYDRICNPVRLRCEAVQGRLEKPEELHVALTHLWKLRGKTNVPWKQEEKEKKSDDQKKEEKDIAAKLDRLEQAMKADGGFKYPCQLLLHRQQHGMKQREEVWPRDEFQNKTFNLKQEFIAILEAQSSGFPKLAGKVSYVDSEDMEQTVCATDWLLYGDTQVVIRNGQERRVYFKTTECKNPGVLGLRWPRFENRNPGLDLLRPFDEGGRALHVVRRNKEVFRETQWEQALFNFRVLEKASGKEVLPDVSSLNRLREIFESAKRKPKKPGKSPSALPEDGKAVEIKISESVLKKWAKEHEWRYQLLEDKTELVSRTGDGRAKFSSATLSNIKQVLQTLSAGQTVDAIQPLLREDGESKEAAMNRFLNDIRHGLVRHRLMLFLRLLRRLVKKHHQPPDFIVVEAVRTLAFSTKKKDEHKREQAKNREKRQQVFGKLKEEGQARPKEKVRRYQLAQETGFICPFCGETFEQADLYNGDVDISHLYPQSLAPCNEFYNLTIAHPRCNRTDMENMIPREAFGSDPIWSALEKHARDHFQGKKRMLFLAKNREDAEKLIESKAPLTATAYISKMVRRLCLIELDWLGEDGRDPTNKEGNIPSRQFLVTNGEITARFRQAWELNEMLHPVIPQVSDAEWNAMTSDEREEHKEARQKRYEKNRGDHRHHALDAMVIACTWPAYAQRVHNATKDWQDKGWWHLDPVKKRLMARHPLFPNHQPMKEAVSDWMKRLIAEGRIKHHASQSKHKQSCNTMFFSRRPDAKKPGQYFYLMRKKLADISPKGLRLRKVYPPSLSDYLYTAWDSYLGKLYAYTEKAANVFARSFEPNTSLKQAGKDFPKRLDWADFLAWSKDETRDPVLPAEDDADRIPLNPKVLPEFRKDNGTSVNVRMPEPEKLLKKMPDDFQKRLCFAHYQKWRENPLTGFNFSPAVKIPIVRVRYRQPVNDNSVSLGPKTIPGYDGGRVYVMRGELQEVRLMPFAHGSGVVPVCIPRWRNDKTFAANEYNTTAKPVLVIRKDAVIRLVKDYSDQYRAGDYLVVKLGAHQISLTQAHIANTKEAKTANNFPASGFQPYLHKLIPALGFEFPKDAVVCEAVEEGEEAENEA